MNSCLLLAQMAETAEAVRSLVGPAPETSYGNWLVGGVAFALLALVGYLVQNVVSTLKAMTPAQQAIAASNKQVAHEVAQSARLQSLLLLNLQEMVAKSLGESVETGNLLSGIREQRQMLLTIVQGSNGQ